MKAVLVEPDRADGPLRLADIEEPRPGQSEILVEVRASALNRADLRHATTHFKGSAGVPTHPVGGLEMTGVVVAGSQALPAGTPVMAMVGAAWAELVTVPEGLVVPTPDRFSWFESAATPVSFITAFDALTRAGRLLAGQTVFVQGATTAVGLATLQLARELGAAEVVGSSTTDWKVDRLRDMGFAAFSPHSPALADHVAEVTAGRGADLVVDVVGGDLVDENIRLAAVRGRIVCVGRVGGAQASMNLDEFARKRIEMVGVTFRTRTLDERLEAIGSFRERALPLLAAGRVRPVVDRVFPLHELPEAEDYMRGGTTFGKVVIDVTAGAA